jgi:hypothetical protein
MRLTIGTCDLRPMIEAIPGRLVDHLVIIPFPKIRFYETTLGAAFQLLHASLGPKFPVFGELLQGHPCRGKFHGGGSLVVGGTASREVILLSPECEWSDLDLEGLAYVTTHDTAAPRHLGPNLQEYLEEGFGEGWRKMTGGMKGTVDSPAAVIYFNELVDAVVKAINRGKCLAAPVIYNPAWSKWQTQLARLFYEELGLTTPQYY